MVTRPLNGFQHPIGARYFCARQGVHPGFQGQMKGNQPPKRTVATLEMLAKPFLVPHFLDSTVCRPPFLCAS